MTKKPTAFVRRAAHHPLRNDQDPYPVNVSPSEVSPELALAVAIEICRSVYGSACACARRPDMPICSTMFGAAVNAVRIIRKMDAGE